jgi:hypothetical protein
MPSFNLTATAQQAPPLSVIGVHSPPRSGIHHVALLAAPSLVRLGQPIPAVHHLVTDFQPPHFWAKLEWDDRQLLGHVLGHVNLSAKQREKGELFLKEIRTAKLRYIAHPPYEEEESEASPERGTPRYNCVGIVLRCYEAMDLPLVQSHETDGFSRISLRQLRAIYPRELSEVTGNWLVSLGLDPRKEPWPVVLPGYVFHALQNGRLPFLPTTPDQARFP